MGIRQFIIHINWEGVLKISLGLHDEVSSSYPVIEEEVGL
jgi:hypothetical protein